MAITNFIPQYWEASLLKKFHETSVADVITTAPTKIEGNKIVFNAVSDVAVKAYSGTVTFDELTTSKVEMNMDQKNYFAFKVDDVDAVQSAGDLIDAHTEEAGAKMQEAQDKVVLTTAMKTANTITAKDVNAYDIVVKCNTALNKKKVPKANRFAVVNSEFLEKLQLDPRFTHHYTVLENGIVEGGIINGTQVVLSEELNNGTCAVCVLHKSAVGYGKQFDEIEALRLQDSFSDGVRGLVVSGAGILRADGVVKCIPTWTQA